MNNSAFRVNNMTLLLKDSNGFTLVAQFKKRSFIQYQNSIFCAAYMCGTFIEAELAERFTDK